MTTVVVVVGGGLYSTCFCIMLPLVDTPELKMASCSRVHRGQTSNGCMSHRHLLRASALRLLQAATVKRLRNGTANSRPACKPSREK